MNTDIKNLILISGPMYAGKSRQLIFLYNEINDKTKVITFKPSLDVRSNEIVSRNGDKIETTSIESPAEILKLSENYEFIFIDEVQFFDISIVEVIKELLNQNKNVIVSGLDLDFKRNEFEIYSLLKQIARVEYKMTAICFECKKTAKFSKKTSSGEGVIEIDTLEDGETKYFSSCDKCHEVPNE